ncbi:MAG: family ATPase [Gaiellaceae bacterium]|jgi:ATP-dependent Zn protease|nr:family ATPase [Gaiellaceae bacterium]
MATSDGLVGLPSGEATKELTLQWRRLIRTATAVAVLTSPVVYFFFHEEVGISRLYSLFWTFIAVIAFRGLMDIIVRRFIPWPSLFGTDEPEAREDDVVNRRRAWYWGKRYRLVVWIGGIITFFWLIRLLIPGGDTSWISTITEPWEALEPILTNPSMLLYAIIFPLFFIMNFVILLGPMMLMGITQMQGFEPGDAEWGVKLDDVRGQAEAKEEVRRVVSIWQSGEAFEAAGGKRERGLLFLGAPGTGKTMLSKAIATGFNCPFVSMPGSGFAQTFMGMDVIIVRYLAWKAKKLARKWGGQCIVFIDEIDAVGRRRSALGDGGMGGFATPMPATFEDFAFHGRNGSLTSTGDLVLETRAWREKIFATRTPERRPSAFGRVSAIVNQAFPGAMMGGMGQLALNQLLVVMDGIDNPPFTKRFFTNRINTFLDATYIVPRRVRGRSLRMPPPRPRTEQIYFIGATNVPLEALDPALTRPGRMGRYVWLRTPTKKDRLDIFDLYLNKVSHDPELDSERRRDEIARITNGYSPAMIEQVCSMALTYAHHEGKPRFGWEEIVEAMTTIESGMAINIEYIPEETRAIAVHEAGHAVAGHAYMKGAESTRLSIRRRGEALGHHQALEKEERFSSWRSEELARLIWTLGAMAAERVFYGENSTGVGGDVQSATARSAWMVGACAMAPERIEFADGFKPPKGKTEDEVREEIAKKYQKIGDQIMNRSGNGAHGDPLAGVLSDPTKRAMASQLLGQAYVAAHQLIEHNRDGVSKVADTLVERRELHGDEILKLLESVNLEVPAADPLEDESWPKL